MMKNFISTVALLGSVIAFAQNNSENTESRSALKFGLTSRLTQTNVRGIHDGSVMKPGASIGVFAELPLQKVAQPSFSFVPVVEFSIEGDRAKQSGQVIDLNHNYVNIPLYLKYSFAISKDATEKRFFVMGGPKLGFMVNNGIKGTLTIPTEIAAEKNLNKFNFGISLGAGYRVIDNVEAFIRYDHGFTKVYNNYATSNYAYQLGAGINYTLYNTAKN